MPSLLRVARRRVSWETVDDIDTLIKAEFRTPEGGPDLSLSVYEVNDEQLVQTFAEHSAGAGLDPPRGGLGVDLASSRRVDATPGETGFDFTVAAHRELRFENEGDLRAFLQHAVIPSLDGRRREVSRGQLREFVQARRIANDAEWMPFLEANPKWASFGR